MPLLSRLIYITPTVIFEKKTNWPIYVETSHPKYDRFNADKALRKVEKRRDRFEVTINH